MSSGTLLNKDCPPLRRRTQAFTPLPCRTSQSRQSSKTNTTFPIATNRNFLAQVDARTSPANAQNRHHATSAAPPIPGSLSQAPAAAGQDPYTSGYRALHPPRLTRKLRVVDAPILGDRISVRCNAELLVFRFIETIAMAPALCDSFGNSHYEYELTDCVFEMRRLLGVCRRFLTANLISQWVLSLTLLGPQGA